MFGSHILRVMRSRIPLLGRKIRSDNKSKSEGLSTDSIWKQRSTDAKITFSSIKANFWPTMPDEY